MKFYDLRDKLPPIIARKDVGTILGGLISPKTLANLDSLGLGPECRLRNGKLIAYPTSQLLSWLDKRQQYCQS